MKKNKDKYFIIIFPIIYTIIKFQKVSNSIKTLAFIHLNHKNSKRIPSENILNYCY